MKKLAGHRFKNRKSITVYAVDEKMKGIPDCDTLCLEFGFPDHRQRFFLRPDEALQTAQFLIEGVYKTTSAYRFDLLKTNGRKNKKRSSHKRDL